MGTSTLHLNNPVPSNGAVAASLGGRHTVTATLSGVGAISCKVQAWASVDGTDSRMIGAPVVISGTTTVSQTLTFNALDVTQFWLAVVEITPACTFTATVENSGDVQFGGAVLARHYGPINPGPWAIGGDSITANVGSASEIALNSLGIQYSQTRYATAGERINQQTPKLALIAAEGIRNCIMQVGANDLIQNRTPAQIYADLLALMAEAARVGIQLHMLYISPLGSALLDRVWLLNVAIYRAALIYGAKTYEIWMEDAALDGGWVGGAAATCGGDDTHPILSRRVTAAARLATKLTGATRCDMPLPRCSHDGIHPNPLFTGAGPVATSWGAYQSPASATRSPIAYGSAGAQWQVITMANPLSGHVAGVNYYGSKGGMGYNDGDRLALMLSAEMTENVEESAYSLLAGLNIFTQFTGPGNPIINCPTKLGYGEREIWWEFNVPESMTAVNTMITLNAPANLTGTAELRLRRANIINLTQNGFA